MNTYESKLRKIRAHVEVCEVVLNKRTCKMYSQLALCDLVQRRMYYLEQTVACLVTLVYRLCV